MNTAAGAITSAVCQLKNGTAEGANYLMFTHILFCIMVSSFFSCLHSNIIIFICYFLQATTITCVCTL